MDFMEFLKANYPWLLVILLLLVITIIGFFADKRARKNKKNKKNEGTQPTININDGNKYSGQNIVEINNEVQPGVVNGPQPVPVKNIEEDVVSLNRTQNVSTPSVAEVPVQPEVAPTPLVTMETPIVAEPQKSQVLPTEPVVDNTLTLEKPSVLETPVAEVPVQPEVAPTPLVTMETPIVAEPKKSPVLPTEPIVDNTLTAEKPSVLETPVTEVPVQPEVALKNEVNFNVSNGIEPLKTWNIPTEPIINNNPIEEKPNISDSISKDQTSNNEIPPLNMWEVPKTPENIPASPSITDVPPVEPVNQVPIEQKVSPTVEPVTPVGSVNVGNETPIAPTSEEDFWKL